MRVAHIAMMLLIFGLLAAPGASAAPPEPGEVIDPSCFEETKQVYESPVELAEALVAATFCLAK